ncbi:MAG: dihydroneopterin aldolase [Kiloniellales bacterium]
MTGPFTTPDGDRSDGPHYRIFVRDLDLRCRIGAHDFERDAPQRVRVNLDMAVREIPGGPEDKLQNVLSYEEVIAGIKALGADGHINLIETLAERIAGLCLEDPRVARVTVRVEKLDVDPAAGGVGVEIERRRAADSPVELA